MKLINGKSFTEVFLSEEGRLSNWEYMIYTATGCIIYIILLKLLAYIPEYAIGLSTTGLAIFWFICRILLGIKRCHDLGHSGAWLLWYLCPIFNLIFPFILYFSKGDDSDNKYGKKPEKVSSKIKTITVMTVIVWRVSICYQYFIIFNGIKNGILEIIQGVTQEVQYESSTQEDILKVFGTGKLEEFTGYNIPKFMLENDKDLIELIIGSQALETTEEKQQRFDIYTLMDNEQIENLRDILIREKEEIAKINEKYQTGDNIELEILTGENISK